MSEKVFVDLDKLRARMLREPITEEQVDLLFALIEDMQRQVQQAITRERAAGADIVALVTAAAAYLAVMTWSPGQAKGWKPGNDIPDYRTPENRLRKLLKGPARPGVELLADVADSARTINDLRAKLDTACQHIGALVADGANEDAQDAARAWLRRTA